MDEVLKGLDKIAKHYHIPLSWIILYKLGLTLLQIFY
jgi:hypothetical protein